ncbi:hypothetical protein H4W80_010455 [Nonomuraea angiospora]|uniref:MBL fold metallo-hydrolase n=1 Tax=Nonomuraea angiospora TaxID=46172 RepID=A0ABR9MIA4_9ACTN|nr:hypothetical protein [Nonomuraea angiospora]
MRRRSFSTFEVIITSIRNRLLTSPPETVVHTGHGSDTTIGVEDRRSQDGPAGAVDVPDLRLPAPENAFPSGVSQVTVVPAPGTRTFSHSVPGLRA